MLTDNKITIIDDQGNEHLMQILFTYDNEERKTSYVNSPVQQADSQQVAVERVRDHSRRSFRIRLSGRRPSPRRPRGGPFRRERRRDACRREG